MIIIYDYTEFKLSFGLLTYYPVCPFKISARKMQILVLKILRVKPFDCFCNSFKSYMK